jgi:hypothetical protein
MEHSAPSLDLARPWRTATVVAASVALLELVVLLIVAATLLADRGPGDAAAAPGAPAAESKGDQAAPKPAPAAAAPKPQAAKPAAPKPKPVLPRAKTSVLVLNGNGITGAAARGAEQVRGAGYRVGGVGNAARADYLRTVVMYRPGRRAEGERLARDLRIPIVGPLDGIRAKDLGNAHAVVVLGK